MMGQLDPCRSASTTACVANTAWASGGWPFHLGGIALWAGAEAGWSGILRRTGAWGGAAVLA